MVCVHASRLFLEVVVKKQSVEQWFTTGLSAHRAGDLAQARDSYEKVLTTQPNHIDALSLLGTVHLQMGQLQQAVDSLQRVIARHPRHPVAHANLALAYHDRGELDLAEQHYREARRLDPASVQAANNLACFLRERGKFDEAEGLFNALLAKHPNYAVGHHNLGLLRRAKGDIEAAIVCYRRAIELDPCYSEAHFNLGNGLGERMQYDQAVESYRRALAIRPQFAEALCNLGVLRFKQGQAREAAELCNAALQCKPNYAEAYQNLGTILEALGDKSGSIESYQRATKLNPSYAEAFSNLAHAYQEAGDFAAALHACEQALAANPRLCGGYINKAITLMKLERHDAAEACLRQALELDPNHFDALINLGSVYTYRLQADLALATYEKALAVDPNNALAHWSRGWILLAKGNLEEGWREYEWGIQTGERRIVQRYPQPPWRGEPLAGKTIVVYAEQGVGDEVLFASCLPDLMRTGARCILQCDPRLVTLFRRSFPGLLVHGGARDEDPGWLRTFGQVDYSIPIGSLPVHYRKNIEDFENRPPYLVPDPEQRQRWRERLAALGPGLKVGIGWRSRLNGALRGRYYPNIEHLWPILRVPGVIFVNLQYDQCTQELTRARQETGVQVHMFEDLDLFNDLDGGVALMAALDMVIAPATTNFNLSAACGAPTWLFYAQAIDAWRLGSAVFPWYQNARLFEQERLWDWDTVAARMASELSKEAQKSHAICGDRPENLDAVLVPPSKDGTLGAFPTLVRSRENPSARYGELLDYYRSMHSQGYARVINGETVYTAAADTFCGSALPNFVRPVRALIRSTGARTILDYGAGKGLQYSWSIHVDGARYHNVQQYWGVERIALYEPALPGCDVLPTTALHGVVCTDVLARIPESDLPWVLEEMFTLAQKFVFANVACYPDLTQLPNGDNAHCTVRTPEWWQTLLQRAASHYPGVKYLVVAESADAGSKDVTHRWLSNFPLS